MALRQGPRDFQAVGPSWPPRRGLPVAVDSEEGPDGLAPQRGRGRGRESHASSPARRRPPPSLFRLTPRQARQRQCMPVVGHAHQPNRVLSCIAERF